MPSVQDTYVENIAPGKAGQQADMLPASVASFNVEPAAGIGFGLPVAYGVRDDGCVMATGTVVPVGITMTDRSASGLVAGGDGYRQYEAARVMIKGRIWAIASVAVVPGNPVFAVPTTGALTISAGGNAAVAIPDARWITTAAPGGLAVIELR